MITYQKIISGIVTVITVTMLFSCEGNLNKVRALENPGDSPQAIGENLNLIYTDSGRVVATLKSDKMLDFTNLPFPYREFPNGVEVEFFDEERRKNTVTADYGIIYDETDLIDLQGNVVLVTSDSTRLEADQLYWDQNLGWVFTDRANTISFASGARNRGQGFDSDLNFTNFRSRTNIGVQVIEETKK
ncbi:LPS export ABC transporter periplasmic protein LptC [Antarcticibacterium sp. 1MA-6-2]|uniref:LPS export ABC transporter periplasmic protein LptC n=1 Tax=Antarcticibacterium sp. 1MA-6-2 TaxID=2908210 RepID=UPI001F400345|nr:LPS export ABC transporter periplasmic protein LptC [Antarcticibacterium sp. 1MA-6-2]UJH89835.1 LPS export ABC transporter periplasmic protein LptC [Antarcticibacterium sp. 1MA-6-2]